MSTALQPCLPRLNSKRIEKAQLRSGAKEFNKPIGVSIPGHKVNRKIFSALQSNDSSDDDDETSPLERPPNSEELKALLADSERSKLVRKLSEANQQNRFLKRQV
ncbi:5-AMP-activated protein kinase-related [Striga hermonthica]|uniref:5-AMP-activated protein kinase-related n=1 Tax=Striga hermonthica TaxID=68872 RepID=A0A9N7RRJ5_STRHE|nr:5-AMP-activated protein kinase-related [Striga hermonthica]